MDHLDYLQKAHLILHSKCFEVHLSIKCTFEIDSILLSKYVERVVNPCTSSNTNCQATNIDNVCNETLLNSYLHSAQVQEISLSYECIQEPEAFNPEALTLAGSEPSHVRNTYLHQQWTPSTHGCWWTIPGSPVVGLDSMVQHINLSQYPSVTSDHQEGKGGMASGGDWISCMPVQPFKNGALLPSVQPWIDNANQTILHPGWLTRKIRRRMLTAQAENGGSRVNPNEPQEVMKYGYGTWMGWWSFRLDCRNSVPGPRWGKRQPSGWYKVKQQIVESSMVQLCAYINAGVLCPCSPHHSILCHSSGNL